MVVVQLMLAVCVELSPTDPGTVSIGAPGFVRAVLFGSPHQTR